MITLDEIQKLADLARLSVTEDEKNDLHKDIEGILGYVGAIKNVKVETTESDAALSNVFRSDVVDNKPGEYTDRLIKAAPQNQNGYVKVKKIL
ncbi:MAG: Asp-tRNA(Asn)/Glu-tRNA(Gln) amidotransferase subunit GatC [Candidatus Taylorbacteria bacterium]|nr:Asp-tRNA(Asn)/Glu-tRNA(Gln) amidotransferase subunit GatC [Candidatus Taylorbacteria bacterium]